MVRWLVALAILVVLGSCAVAPQRQPAPESTPEPIAAEPSRLEWLAQVRAAAEDAGDVIQVKPLRDPAVTDLLDLAAERERTGDLSGATEMLRQALLHVPEDPQLMQEYAELLLAVDRLDDAEMLAARSFDTGPKLGGLCRRNWTTLLLARQYRGDDEGAAVAAEQIGRCIVEPQLRM
jgi:predicted Zn-dependent protease